MKMMTMGIKMMTMMMKMMKIAIKMMMKMMKIMTMMMTKSFILQHLEVWSVINIVVIVISPSNKSAI